MKTPAPFLAKLNDHGKDERESEALSIQVVTMAGAADDKQAECDPPSAETKSLMMNRFRIKLGFLPQHLPQQIKLVKWRNRREHASRVPTGGARARTMRPRHKRSPIAASGG